MDRPSHNPLADRVHLAKSLDIERLASACGGRLKMVETKTEQIGDVTVVEISGRLHLGNSLSYAENSINRLIDGGTRKLVIDLTRLEYIDSSGLGMLIFCGGRMEQIGGKMRVAGAAGGVAHVFEVAQASRILQFDADLASACSNLSAQSAAG
jgi:anti-sigma B factor antagonist